MSIDVAGALGMLLGIPWLFLAVFVNELGRVFFGLLSGYRFLFLKQGPFIWWKEDEKTRFKFAFSTEKAMLRHVLLPSKDEKDFRYVLYFYGGTIVNSIAIALALVAIFIVHSRIEDDLLREFVLRFLYMFFLANGVAIYGSLFRTLLGGGQVLSVLRKAEESSEAERGLYLHMLVQAETTQGKRYREYDNEIFRVSTNANLKNYFISRIVELEALRLYDLGKYDECIQEFERLNLEEVDPFDKRIAFETLLYIYIVHRPDFEKVKQLFPFDKMQSTVEHSFAPSAGRIMSAYEFFVNGDERNVKRQGDERSARRKAKRLLKEAKSELEFHYPNKGLRMMENEYIENLEKMYVET